MMVSVVHFAKDGQNEGRTDFLTLVPGSELHSLMGAGIVTAITYHYPNGTTTTYTLQRS